MQIIVCSCVVCLLLESFHPKQTNKQKAKQTPSVHVLYCLIKVCVLFSAFVLLFLSCLRMLAVSFVSDFYFKDSGTCDCQSDNCHYLFVIINVSCVMWTWLSRKLTRSPGKLAIFCWTFKVLMKQSHDTGRWHFILRWRSLQCSKAHWETLEGHNVTDWG